MIAGVDGFVLAGGLSSRMGRDKALLELGGRTFLEIAFEKLRGICEKGSVLCGDVSRKEGFRRFGEVVPDREPGLGPLGGVVSAMFASQAAYVLVLPVDLPALPEHILHRWVASGIEEGVTAQCFRAQGVVQPLPVLARRQILGSLEMELVQGRGKLRPALEFAALASGGRGLRITDADALDVMAGHWFRNINTPEDLRRAQVESLEPEK